MKMKVSKKIILILVMMLLLAGCAKSNESAGDMEQYDETMEAGQFGEMDFGAQQSTTVSVQKLEINTFEKYIGYGAKAEPEKQRTIEMEIAGSAADVYVKAGDQVKIGQNLYAIDKNQAFYQIQNLTKQKEISLLEIKTKEEKLAKLKAEGKEAGVAERQGRVDSAKLQYQEAKTTYEINQDLIKQGSITNQVFEASKLDYQQKKNALEATEKDLDYYSKTGFNQELRSMEMDLQQSLLRKTELENNLKDAKTKKENLSATSPLNGFVSSLTVEEGVQTSKGQMKLVSIDKMKATFGVSEKVLDKIKVGDSVKVRVGDSNKDHQGKITEINPFADEKTNNYTVKISIENKEHVIKPGMILDIRLTTYSSKGIVIPSNAILETIDKSYVFKVVDGMAVQQFIEKGHEDGERVEVLEGLVKSDQLIISGHHIVKDKDKVNIVGAEQ